MSTFINVASATLPRLLKLWEAATGNPAIDECVVLAHDSSSLAAVVSPADDPPDEEAIHARVAEANASFSPDERIGRVVIAPEPFSVDNGMLTSQFNHAVGG